MDFYHIVIQKLFYKETRLLFKLKAAHQITLNIETKKITTSPQKFKFYRLGKSILS